MDGKLLCEVIQGIKAVAGVEAFLVLLVAALHLTVVARGVGADELVSDAQLGSGRFKREGRSRLFVEKRLVNSGPLSVWTHSTRMPRRAYHLTSLLRKSAEE